MKKRYIPIKCSCKKKLSRQRYGVNRCDTYSFDYNFGNIFANGLLMYVEHAKKHILRDDWDLIEKHAQAIRDYSAADNWDELSKEEKVKMAYQEKQKAWEEAMSWLTKNWQGLWW